METVKTAHSNPETEKEKSEGQPAATQGAQGSAPSTSGSPGSPGPDDTQKKIQDLEAQVKEKENKFLYLYADFENFKKRTLKERSDLLKFGWEGVAHELLLVLDNLERALAHAGTADKVMTDGLNMILSQFKAALSKNGVQPVESIGKSFDPNLHEAIGTEASDQPPGTIVGEHARGYMLHGRLIRPARVVVSEAKK